MVVERAMTRPTWAPSWSRLAWPFAVLLLAAGCVGTPVPQPPAHQPPDPAMFAYEPVGTGPPAFFGRPGSAEPGTMLWIAPLDTPQDPLLVEVQADGSFMTGLFVPDGQELRVQTRSAAGRSRPIDVRVPVGGEIVRDTEACLVVPAELELPPGPVGVPVDAVLALENVCLETHRIGAARLWRAAPAWSIGSTPLEIPPESTVELAVRFIPEAGLSEEILFLDVDLPTSERRPVTLIGSGE